MPQLASSSDPTTSADGDDRNLLIALGRSDQPYRFLDQAFAYLGRVESDPEVVLLTLSALVKLGLGGPARELLQVRTDIELGVDVDGLRKSLTSVPTGRVPWDRFRGQFEANRKALAEHHPELAERVSALHESRRRVDLFQTLDGQYHVSTRATGRLRSWLPGLLDHAAVAGLELPLAAGGPAAVVVGIALNQLIDRAYGATQPDEGAEGAPLFVVDPDVGRLSAWLHVADRTAVLANERVYFFVGPDALETYERFFQDNEDIAVPEVHLCASWAPQLGEQVQQIGQRVTTRRNEAFRELANLHEQRGRERDAAYWSRRLEPGARILGFTSRFTTMLQYSMRDIGHALAELGYEFDLIIETADHRTHTTLTTSRAIYDADPALVIMINHFRSERALSLGNVPVLTWVQDPSDLVFSKKTGTSLGPLDFVCGYYSTRCTGEFSYPESRFFPAPLPVSTRMFHDGPVDPAEKSRYAADMMYVGHLHATFDEHRAKWRSSTPKQLHPMLDRIDDEVQAMIRRGQHLELHLCKPYIVRLAKEMELSLTDDDQEKIANFYMYRLFDIAFRRETLLWIAQWAGQTGRVFKLYGRGWSRDPVLCNYAAGPIEHGEPLRRAYYGSKLSVQTIPGGYSHQRTYEALASGRLVLGRLIPPDFSHRSLEEFRQNRPPAEDASGTVRTFPSLDRVVFRDAEELATLAETLLDDDDLRCELQAEFAAIVRRDLTYTRVLQEVLERIRVALAANTTAGDDV